MKMFLIQDVSETILQIFKDDEEGQKYQFEIRNLGSGNAIIASYKPQLFSDIYSSGIRKHKNPSLLIH